MKILTKLCFAVALLSMGALRAAQAPVQKPRSLWDWPTLKPVQEPIYGTQRLYKIQQWQQAGRASLPGLYENAGANSLTNELPQCVAQDIVKLAKPKEEYGFIKNFTDKAIVHFTVPDDRDPNARGLHFLFSVIEDWNRLAPKHQLRCFLTEKGATFIHQSCEVYGQWRPWEINKLDWINIQFQDEHEMFVGDVNLSGLMNFEVYEEESGRIRVVVTSPYHAPVSYYAEPIKS